ncbi:MAG: sulfate adenylyltransferase subunit CysN, partial [Methylococcaceae bacterium]|nr:sulfate adenylyltransferase subunit CysN [Methylococcaceae bacterium]
EDEIDVSRGDMLVGNQTIPATITDKFKATLVWMTEQPLIAGRQYTIKLATRSVSGSITLIHHRIDVNTLEHHDAKELKLNEIGSCTVSVNAPVVIDPYKTNKGTGAFIIIDRLTNGTVGAGMITGIHDDEVQAPVSSDERAARFSQVPTAVSLTGSKRIDIAYQLERRLFDNGHASTVLEIEATALLIDVIKNAGLIGLFTQSNADLAEVIFDTDKQSLDDIYALLKEQKVIY